jgi:hypothetical protein
MNRTSQLKQGHSDAEKCSIGKGKKKRAEAQISSE